MDYDWAKWDFHCKRKKRTIYTNIIPFRQGFFFWGKGSLSRSRYEEEEEGGRGGKCSFPMDDDPTVFAKL